MNDAASLPGDWSRRRFWSLVAILFALQVGLILLFGKRHPNQPKEVTDPSRFALLEQPLSPDELSQTFFAADPTVSPLPSPHGFSGRAWLGVTPPEFEVSPITETPAWLKLKVDQLGTNFPSLNHRRLSASTVLPEHHQSEAEPWPVFLTPEVFRTNSVFEVKGELSDRELNAPNGLRSWPSAQLLRKSVVQIAVNSSGQVVASRLEEPRSGLVAADQNALQVARGLRFRPVAAAAPVWGEAVFDWQTLEPTNTKAH